MYISEVFDAQKQTMHSFLHAMSRRIILLSLLFLVLSEHRRISTVHAASSVHIVYMGERQHHDPMVVSNSHLDMLASVLGSKEAASESLIYSYRHGFSGFAAKLTESHAQTIAEFPGVVHVTPNRFHKPHTTRSWDFLGLDLHSQTNLLSGSNMGDGVIIGVVDTGIWPESESFNDKGLGPVPSRWKGVCQSGQRFNSTNCNRKLIGARWYIKGLQAELGKDLNITGVDYLSPRDGEGHGTHTSAIAAGSLVENVSYKGLGIGTARGGAPKARLAMYKVCWSTTLSNFCSTSADILKAFDDAIHDGVDVLSLSLGPSPLSLYFDVDERNGIAVGAFHAVAKGITVVCAAGNDGSVAQTVSNTSPWVITVAASSIDRAFPTVITLGNNRTITGQGMFTGNKEIGFVGLVYPLDAGEVVLTTASAASLLSADDITIAGKVALFFGSSPILEYAVKDAGGVGIIFARNPSIPVSPCSELPCIEVDREIGMQLLYYIRSSRSPLVKLSPSKTLVGKPLSTKVAFFSSRGPSAIAPAILKPDVAAPGVNILSAVPYNSSYGGYRFLRGTSMACPHVSGIVALLKSIHPQWSPAAIKSALVTTASTSDESGGPIFADGYPRKVADPFDYGGGIVNPNRAAYPGLIYDMGMEDYLHYLCSMGYTNSAISRLTQNSTVCPIDPPSILNLNLPSITVPNLNTSITILRTVTNVGPVNSVYNASIEPPPTIHATVQPHILIFNSTAKKLSFTVTLSSTRKVIGGYYFGSLTWSDGVHTVRSPISVKPEIIPSYVDNS
ncbi:subtilisin-like protease SBT3.9 [Magnolia sinica]|uniref:subtilisin-like protease SBT3.9 n=1 Tax=Magnolia sinica TaxID=86752 RepID=UPI002657E2AB|nr:subtilisin-like protease SBT3.9 [Magnolia sinica]